MVPTPVRITYFDPFDVFKNVKGEFLKTLPFKNLHWKTASGVVKTIDTVPVDLLVDKEGQLLAELSESSPFIRLLVVTCGSIDDYRSKVRPLVRQWLPQDGSDMEDCCMNIILLHANTEVVDAKMFKSISLIEKFTKDFPATRVLELKSVYKSPQKKEEFWSHFNQQIKTCIMHIFQKRLDYYQNKLRTLELSSSFEEFVLQKENILELYLKFRLLEDVEKELDSMKSAIISYKGNSIAKGVLEVPFVFDTTLLNSSISNLLKNNHANFFSLYKYFFTRKVQILELGSSPFRPRQLYSTVLEFLQKIESFFHDDTSLWEFKYYFVDSVLSFLTTVFSSDTIPQLEVQGSLLLLKRDIWLRIALSSTEFTLPYKSLCLLQSNYSVDNIKGTFKDYLTFNNTYIQLTTEALSKYNLCHGKCQRIADILSIEIGLFYNENGEHEKAVAVFKSCYEYYIQKNWTQIGLKILEVFIDSISKCTNLKTLEIQGEQVPVATILSNAYLNVLKLTTDMSKRETWWKEFLTLQLVNNETDLIYSLEGLFKVQVFSTISLAIANTYSLEVSIENFILPQDVEANKISITMKDSQDQFVVFTADNIIIGRGANKYRLYSREITFGEFTLVLLEIEIGRTTFTKEYMKECQSFCIQPLYDPDNVSVIIKQATELRLGRYALEVSYKNIEAAANFNLSIRIKPDTQTGLYPITFAKDGSDLFFTSFTAPNLPPNIEYHMKGQDTKFTIEVDMTFTRDQQNFRECRLLTLACYLPLSVSVEDIFKRDFFCFRFLLNSSTGEEPVVLHSSHLSFLSNQPEKYLITGQYEPEKSEILSENINSCCLNCYMVKPAEKYDCKDIFHLEIKYNTVKEEINNLVTEAILVEGDLEWYAKFEPWRIVWEESCLPYFYYDYKEYATSRKVKLLPNSMSVKEVSSILKQLSIEADVCTKMLKCVESLNRGIQLPEVAIDAYTKNLSSRRLIVPVTLPEFEQLFYVEFERQNVTCPEVGTPIEVTIHVKSLHYQWEKSEFSASYVFEILNSNDWLIAGKRKFLLAKHEQSTSISMIPLKRGYLAYPRIDIKTLEGVGSRIDYTNLHGSILVP